MGPKTYPWGTPQDEGGKVEEKVDDCRKRPI